VPAGLGSYKISIARVLDGWDGEPHENSTEMYIKLIEFSRIVTVNIADPQLNFKGGGEGEVKKRGEGLKGKEERECVMGDRN